jgi:hypothetical protein
MADRVEVDPERLTRLDGALGGTKGEEVTLSLVEVVNQEVHVQLLGDDAIRPGRGDVVVDLLEGNGGVTAVKELDPRHLLRGEVAERLDLESGEAGVEVGEGEGVGAVERDQLEVGQGHRRAATPSPAS